MYVQLGFVGLGRMGASMVARVRRAGHNVVGYDVDPTRSEAPSLDSLVSQIDPPRHVWMMVPAGGAVEQTIIALARLLDAGDVVVDGGNTHWVDDQRRADALGARGVGYVDCGVSGGVWGGEHGYALMAGGSDGDISRLMPVFEALKPPGDAGFVHAGPTGAGHFAKMVHNGIEYGLMQAYAEGVDLLQTAGLVRDVPGVLASWTQGTVVRSWLLDLAVRALREDPALATLRGYADDSGEGRWMLEAAIAHAVPVPAISAALYARFASRRTDSPAMKMVAALRREFGGHDVTDVSHGPQSEADEPTPATPARHEPAAHEAASSW
jgi:6-phosphogluconate dehydrogenase